MSRTSKSKNITSTSELKSNQSQDFGTKGIKDNLIFKQCADISDDPFWRDLFNSGYKGIFPKGITYKNGHLLYGSKTVQLSDIPSEAYSQITSFYTNMKGIKSKMDIERELYQNTQRRLKFTSNNSWSAFKSKNVKTILISDYLLSLKEKYSISEEKFKELYTIVRSAITSGNICGKDIEMEDGTIKNISSLIWDDVQKNFIIKCKAKSARGGRTKKKIVEEEEEVIKSEEDDTQKIEKSPIKSWNKYLTGFCKSSYSTRKQPQIHEQSPEVSQGASTSLFSDGRLSQISSSYD